MALFITFRVDEGAALSTLDQELAAIGTAHRLAGCRSPREEPLVRDVRRGIRREKGAAQKGKTPLLARDLQHILSRLPDTLQGARDRALLLLGFAAALRRSELVALEVKDVVFTEGD